MQEFGTLKDRKHFIQKFKTFSERRETDDDLKQTFINRTIGNFNLIKNK